MRATSGANSSAYTTTLAVTTPGQSSTPNPANNATNVVLTGDTRTLTWIAGSGATSHDVYFGTTSSSVTSATRATRATAGIYKGNQTAVSYVATAAAKTNYWWRIDAVKDGVIIKGTVWTFKTK